MRARWMLAAAILAGCGREHPAESPLVPGSRAVIVDPKEDAVMVDLDRLLAAPVGSEVVVIHDPGGLPGRMVRIRLAEGKDRGALGRVQRGRLRPAR